MRMSHLFVIAIVTLSPYESRAQNRGHIPESGPGTVTLPVADYNRLIDRAAQPERVPDPPPVAAVIARADLRARVAGETARGTLRLDGEVLGHGHVKIPLVSGATLIETRADGRPLPLLQEGDVHAAVLPGPSPFAVTLEWAVPLSSSPGRASFALPVPAGGTVTATLDLPGDPADVRVDPGVVTRRQTAAGRTIVDVALEPGRRAQVSWSVREATLTTAPVESRTLADVKSLVTIGDGDLQLVSLIDITVVRGEPRTFEIRLPRGYEVSAISGPSLESTATDGEAVTLTVRDASRRRHQFLLALEQARSAGSFRIETSFPAVIGAQREIGEAAIEAVGTADVSAAGDDALRRMDVKEIHASLRSLARQPLLAAFRYQRRQDEARVLTLDVKRFADAPVIAAAAERAVVTTLVTAEGRMLTEVQLTIRNRAQPFMRVTLPAGATMLSVEVAGETAKPALGHDGTRVPLLRTGFRPDGPYMVSFVYVQAGQAFAKRGDARMLLPAIDLPVGILEWELFLPDRFSAKPTDGNVIPAGMVATGALAAAERGESRVTEYISTAVRAGQILGRVTDPAGAAVPGVTVILQSADGRQEMTRTDQNGVYVLYSVPSGTVVVRAELAGFRTAEHSFVFDQRPRGLDFELAVGALTETVTVTASGPGSSGGRSRDERSVRENEEAQQQAPSQNVFNLQRRVAGVLPVRIDVPRTGTAHRFVRLLVLDEETRVTFRYKRR